MLKEAEKLNPRPWVEHSLYVAEGAKLIASRCKGMNGELAYIVGRITSRFREKIWDNSYEAYARWI